MSRKARNWVGAVTAVSAVMIAGTGAAIADESHAKAVKPFANNVIVIRKSIGGIALGESPSTARKRFAKKHCSAAACQYAGSGYQVEVIFGSKPNSTKSTVDYISLSSTKGKDAATAVRTASGVGLGSTYARAKKGLAHAKFYGTKKAGYFFIGNGKVGSTDSTFYLTNGVVTQVNVQRLDRVG